MKPQPTRHPLLTRPLCTVFALASGATVAFGSTNDATVPDDSSPTVTLDSGGLQVRSADGNTQIKIGGRIQVDATLHSPDSAGGMEATDGTELRRGRIEMKGRMPNDVRWAAEVDFANNATSVKDFWFGFAPQEGPMLTFGHQKQPYSLAVEMSSNDIAFVERSVDNFLVIPFVDRALGVRVQDHTDNTFYAAGVFGDSVSPSPMTDEGYGVVGRYVYAPVIEDDQIVHVGARAAHRVPTGADTIRIRDETTNMSDFRVVDTGTLTGVDSVTMWGGEAAWVSGPFSVSGEFNQLRVQRSGEDYDFSSWHVATTYSLTGESLAEAYRVDAGEFKRLRAPKGEQAWEVAARIANIDLNDGTLSGGSEDAASLELNWYVNRNLRILFGWTHLLDTSGGSAATAAAQGADIFTVRGQLNF